MATCPYYLIMMRLCSVLCNIPLTQALVSAHLLHGLFLPSVTLIDLEETLLGHLQILLLIDDIEILEFHPVRGSKKHFTFEEYGM
jgi:hypothetical protein